MLQPSVIDLNHFMGEVPQIQDQTTNILFHVKSHVVRPSDWAQRDDTDKQKWTRFDSGGSIGGV